MERASWELARNALSIESKALKTLEAILEEESFGRAVDALKNAPRIATSGCGHSGIACMHLAHLLCCIERPARYISPAEAIHGGMGFVQSGDVLLLASRGGRTAELLPMLGIGKEKGAVLIGVTENGDSPLGRETDIWLRIRVDRETDPDNTQGTTSFCVMNSLFDALQTALISETGYGSEQFARIHPGGAVGERLTGRGKTV
ncbi:MAG: SIS domain-containing protein [Treponema sp.]|jgi:D-arabinose 5-phosphate isomerase GutQ|nr:SIS domain-containing protein [Treponema sp.]